MKSFGRHAYGGNATGNCHAALKPVDSSCEKRPGFFFEAPVRVTSVKNWPDSAGFHDTCPIDSIRASRKVHTSCRIFFPDESAGVTRWWTCRCRNRGILLKTDVTWWCYLHGSPYLRMGHTTRHTERGERRVWHSKKLWLVELMCTNRY